MSRRRRALLFLALALLAAAGAAVLAAGYGASAVRGYGPLRPVVVLAADLPAGRRIGPAELRRLESRRVPERFAPPDALARPEEALGLVTRGPLPAGSYLTGAQLKVRHGDRRRARSLRGDRRPVEIMVSGAAALLSASPAAGSRVDVVVTGEPSGPGPGRTYLAAAAVPLLALRPGPEGSGPGTTVAATLGLTRKQALRLIAAESFARKVTLLPGG